MANSTPDDHPPAGRKLRTSEAAVLFGVSDRTIRRWARAGLLPAWRLDDTCHWRIPAEEAEKAVPIFARNQRKQERTKNHDD